MNLPRTALSRWHEMLTLQAKSLCVGQHPLLLFLFFPHSTGNSGSITRIKSSDGNHLLGLVSLWNLNWSVVSAMRLNKFNGETDNTLIRSLGLIAADYGRLPRQVPETHEWNAKAYYRGAQGWTITTRWEHRGLKQDNEVKGDEEFAWHSPDELLQKDNHLQTIFSPHRKCKSTLKSH